MIKKILIELEKTRIKKKKASVYQLSLNLNARSELIRKLLKTLEKRLLVYHDDSYKLTEKGRRFIKVGAIGGVFDIIHLGHIATLKEAKKKCDILAVIIARDKVVEKTKGKKPINPENKRLKMIESLKPVDLAILGDLNDFKKPIERINPDIIFLGYDQDLPEQLQDITRRIEVIRLNVHITGESTTDLLNRIKELKKERPET